MKKMSKLRYHHIGIPTKTPIKGEHYLPDYKLYHCGYENSEYGIEWMRYEDGCDLPEIVKNQPHVAFEVDDIYEAIKGKKVVIQPNSPSDGVLVAFIEENGAPIELIQLQKFIAYCGLDCFACDAFIATKNNDDQLREKVAAEWRLAYNAPVTAADINCTGCCSEGKKTYYCSTLCEVRKCAQGKGVTYCSACQEFPCSKLKEIFQHAPEARQNLLERI